MSLADGRKTASCCACRCLASKFRDVVVGRIFSDCQISAPNAVVRLIVLATVIVLEYPVVMKNSKLMLSFSKIAYHNATTRTYACKPLVT